MLYSNETHSSFFTYIPSALCVCKLENVVDMLYCNMMIKPLSACIEAGHPALFVLVNQTINNIAFCSKQVGVGLYLF
jgi:hypothetical protein